ncbi:hypothetical protein ACLESO_13515 [Pyxidicoccus sp. 3LG]
MNATKQLAADFLRWWMDPGSHPDFRSQFAPGFSYRKEPVGLSDEDAVWLIEQSLPWEEVQVKSLAFEGDTAVLEIEGIDPVTRLRHRKDLRIVIQGNSVVSVVERGEILD